MQLQSHVSSISSDLILFLEPILSGYACSNEYPIYTNEIFRLLIDFSTNRRQVIQHGRSYHELLSRQLNCEPDATKNCQQRTRQMNYESCSLTRGLSLMYQNKKEEREERSCTASPGLRGEKSWKIQYRASLCVSTSTSLTHGLRILKTRAFY